MQKTNDNCVLEIKNLTKSYKLYDKPSDRLLELFFKRKKHKIFYANKNITFNLLEGETLGIIGVNGAGKSTLLKQIAGVTKPTSGEIKRYGRVTALLELGTGFNPEFTGLENIYLNGMLIGMKKDEIKDKVDSIIEFSELGDFIDEPLKTYSSGMTMRLAFSIAIHSEPQVLIVDEALSVGDAYFSAKCTRALKELKKKNLSIIYVSHDLNSLKLLCDRLILLNKGEIVDEGEPERVINKYNYLIAKLDKEQDGKLNIRENSCQTEYGNYLAQIKNVRIYGVESNSNVISSGEEAVIEIEVESHKDINDVTLGILIRDKFGQDIFGTNTFHYDKNIKYKKNHTYIYKFEMVMNIGIGKYTLTVALHSQDNHLSNCFHWKDKAVEFEIAGVKGSIFIGIVRLNPLISIEECL